MAKTAKKSAQVKSRQTKLEKKSHEELVNIVLKKDKVEANLKSQVSNLKGEINTLTSRVNNFNKDQEGNMNEINRLRDTNRTNRERIDSLRIELKDLKEEYDKEIKYSTELEQERKSYKTALFIALAFNAICLCGWILC